MKFSQPKPAVSFAFKNLSNRTGVFICLLLLTVGVNPLGAATEPAVNPMFDPLANETDVAKPEPNIDPTSLTAYGETEYIDADISEENQDFEEQYNRARMAFLFGNYEYSYSIWETLAYLGHSKSQANIAWMFHTGKGVKKNMRRAVTWYRIAADNNHIIAQNNLGVMYEQGVQVRKSYKKAAKYYREAALMGYSFAQYNLGMLYLSGKGVKKNRNEAIYWLEIASLQGVKEAQARLEKLSRKSKKHKNTSKKTSKDKRHFHKAQPDKGKKQK